MSLADELTEESVKSPYGVRCPVGQALITLDPADVDALRAALADRATYSGPHIANVLARRGYKIKDRAVARHRRGGCGCDAG